MTKIIRERIQHLRALHVPTAAYTTLETQVQKLIEQRRADLADGIPGDPRGIVLVGRSGSGKTTAFRHLARNNAPLFSSDPAEDVCEFISMKVPSPASMKYVGSEALRALGYPYSGDKQGPAIWDQVKVQLKLRRTLFLHLDEAQDLARYQTDKERQSVVNTLKSVMENSLWPVGLMLSGMPDLKKIVNQDPQLARRLYPVEIERLHAIRDARRVLGLVQLYADEAEACLDETVRSENFVRRLVHAADYEFGLLAEIIVQALTKGLSRTGEPAPLVLTDFADVFHDRSSCSDAFNPFLAENFERIDARLIFDQERKSHAC